MTRMQNQGERKSWKSSNGHGKVMGKYFVKFVGTLGIIYLSFPM